MIEYRREIDGLRSIAVTSVVLFHAGLSVLPGGYLGVDIFFVISGFLITSILLRELDKGTYSIVNFYERRFRRIMPAMFLVAFTTVIPAVFLLAPSQLEEFGRSLAATAAFVSNLLFAYEVDYFSNAAELKPLVHTWSLAVEEQFYIFFPLLLAFLFPKGKKIVFGVILAIILVSIASAFYGAAHYSGVSFFLTTGRLWELAIGCIAAVVQFHHPQKGNNAYAGAGFLMILAPMFFHVDMAETPSLYTVHTAIPVIGAALVILYGRIETLVGKALALSPFVFIGLLSYSAYLWHQPLFAYARVIYHGEAPHYVMGGLAVLAYVLAYLTWKFVENPPRRKRDGFFSRKWIFIWSAIGLTTMVVLGLSFAKGIIKSKVEINALMIDAVPEWQAAQDWFVDNPSLQSEWKAYSDPSKINVLVVGDSHSLGTFNTLYNQQISGPLSDYQFIRIGLPMRCLETRGEGGSRRDIVDFCMGTMADKQNPDVFKDVDIILYSIRWNFKDYVNEYVQDLVNWGLERKIRSVFLSNTPEWLTASPEMIRQVAEGKDVKSMTDADFNKAFEDNLDPKIAKLNARIKPLVESTGALYLSKQDYACYEEGKCFAVSPDMEALHTDYGHMTRAGARFFGKRIAELNWFAPVKAYYEAPLGTPAETGEGSDYQKMLDDIDNVLGIKRGKIIEGTAENDVLEGTDGDDTIRGLQGDDELSGGLGNDVLVGGKGNDILRTGEGRDRVQGGLGDDVMYLTSQTNIVRGDQGADVFVIDYERGMTTFIDFRPAQGDKIDVSSFMASTDFDKLKYEQKDGRNIIYVSFKNRRFVFRNIPQESISPEAFIFSDTKAQ